MSGTRRPAAAIARRSPDRMLTRLPDFRDGALPARLNVLRDRPFRLFLLAQLTSWLGDFTAAPALAFAVLDLHGTPDDIGIVLAARSVPLVLFMLLGGVVADRLPRHLVMLGADVVRVVTQAATALLVIDGSGPLWGVAVLQFLGGSASAMFMPAVSGLMQTMVEPQHRQAANSLRSTSQSAAMVAGPLLSALLTLDARRRLGDRRRRRVLRRQRGLPRTAAAAARDRAERAMACAERTAHRLAGVPLPHLGVVHDRDGVAEQHAVRRVHRARPRPERTRTRRAGRVGRDHRVVRGRRRPWQHGRGLAAPSPAAA